MTFVVFAILMGLFIGSFLNVCIYRWPRDLSVVRPRSHCPSCKRTVSWYDNLPVASYLALGGRCRYCGAAIPIRYLLVELITALVFGYLAITLGPTPAALKYCTFSAILIGLIFADLEERILPDEFTIGGAVIGLGAAAIVRLDSGLGQFLLPASWGPRGWSVGEAVLGAVVCSFFLWLTGILYARLRNREGLGFGDVKMVAMIGAFLGLHGALLTLILSSIGGSIIGLIYIKATHKDAASYGLPFGSFLGIAALGVAMFGPSYLYGRF